MLTSLLLVCILAVVVLRWLRPWLQTSRTVAGQHPPVKVLHTTRLPGGQALHVVQLDGKARLLIGTGPNAAPRLIADIPD
jgi:hypothetical protein